MNKKRKARLRSKAWRRANSAYCKTRDASRRLMRRYGITLADKEALIIKQKRKCALCGRDLSPSLSECAIDHCHETKQIRGVVHRGCNIALARLGDNKEAIYRLTSYFFGVDYGRWLKEMFEYPFRFDSAA